MNLKKLLFAAVIVLSASASFAQDTKTDNHNVTINIPNIALLDLEFVTGDAIFLEGEVTGKEAGLPISFENAKNSDTWINYTSIVSKTATTSRNVTVKISEALPKGLKLTVSAAAAAVGKGNGKMGISETLVTPITLSEITAKDIIKGIGSAYTGNGNASGHNLTYQLGFAGTPTDFADLDLDKTGALITITYTLSDM